MRILTLLTAVSMSLAFAGCGGSPDAPDGTGNGSTMTTPAEASADMMDGQGNKVGTALFWQQPDGVLIELRMTGLAAGPHAMHLHTVGECHGPDFKSAGAHFNPYGKKHGLKNPEGAHAGDLPNFDAASDGTATVKITANQVTLKEGRRNSLFQPGGTCLVVHEKADDYTTDPAGNAGARIACGVIKK